MRRRVRTSVEKQPPARIEAPCPTCGRPRRLPNGNYLRWLREQAGINQRALASRCRVSGPYLSDIERNRRACPPDIFAAYLALWERA